MLTGADYDTSSYELLEQLRWKNLETKHRFNKAVLVYHNILNNGTAPCLRKSFSERSVNENGYNLRNYDTDLSIPRPKKEFLKRSFKYRGTVLWNSLSREAKLSMTIACVHEIIEYIYDYIFYSVNSYIILVYSVNRRPSWKPVQTDEASVF